MFSPGDVVQFWNEDAEKKKYHLCINVNGCFLYLNSPKPKTYPGDFQIDRSDIPCLPPTSEGYSIISCSVVLRRNLVSLKRLKAKKLGVVSRQVLLDLVAIIESSEILSEEDRDSALDGLGNWL